MDSNPDYARRKTKIFGWKTGLETSPFLTIFLLIINTIFVVVLSRSPDYNFMIHSGTLLNQYAVVSATQDFWKG
jgi:hypothetical protein